MFGGRTHVLDEQKFSDLYLIDFLTMVQPLKSSVYTDIVNAIFIMHNWLWYGIVRQQACKHGKR